MGLSTKRAMAASVVVLTLGCALLGMVFVNDGKATSIERSGPTQGSDLATERPMSSEPEAEKQIEPVVIVHVDGAVANPGVYTLDGESPRVNDAILLAGGLVADADTTTLNLAATLSDGQKVHVPVIGEVAQMPVANAEATGIVDGEPSLVNVNSATSEELQSLPGVGEATASAILTERENNGPFETVDDLVRVSGIGEKKLEKMREHVCV